MKERERTREEEEKVEQKSRIVTRNEEYTEDGKDDTGNEERNKGGVGKGANGDKK